MIYWCHIKRKKECEMSKVYRELLGGGVALESYQDSFYRARKGVE